MKKIPLLFYTICLSVLPAFATGISISSLSSTSGAVGSSVTIAGTGFSATAAQDIVLFGAAQAIVTAASATSLTVTVPDQCTYEPVSVTNLATNLTAYSEMPYDVTFSGGSTNFAPRQDFLSGFAPDHISVTDVDGDGNADLVVSDYEISYFYVLHNTSTVGAASFVSDTLTIGDGNQGTFSQITADLDGDGKADVIAVMQGDNTIAVRRNTSTPGIISFAAQSIFPTGSYCYNITAGDIDGDGKPDLIVNVNQDSGVVILRNTSTLGAISFAAPVGFPPAWNGYFNSKCIIADIDGDGRPDVVASENSLSILRNTSSPGIISFAAAVTIAGAAQAAADIDGDGKPDLISSNRDSTLSVYLNTSSSGSISFANPVNFTMSTAGYGYLAIGDINGDGKPDVAVSDDNVSVRRNTSTPGTISFAAEDIFTAGDDPQSLGIVDIDGDGKPDLAVVETNGNVVSVYLQIPGNASGIVPMSAASTDVSIYGRTGAIVVDRAGAGEATITVTNLLGQQIIQTTTTDSRAELPVQPGDAIYLVSVMQNGVQTNKKVLVR